MAFLPDIFSKGLCAAYGASIPQQYATDMRNFRVKNGVSIPRPGYKKAASQTGNPVRALASNNGNLYAVQGGRLRKADFVAGTFSDLGSVAVDQASSCSTYDKYTVVFTDGTPYVYDGTTLSAVTTFVASSNPRFAVPFANFLWAAGGNSGSSSKRNVLYVSRPASPTNPQYCYDWTGSGSDAILCPADILALASTLSRIFIFQDGRIDWIDKSSYTTIGGVTTFFRNPLALGDKVASKDCAVAAGDKLFYMTDRKRIRTVGYAVGVDQPEIGDLSEDPAVGIQLWLDRNLSDDQSGAFGWYDQANRLVKFHVRSRTSAFNDLVVSWDMVNKTFVVDGNKLFGAAVNHLGSSYAGSSVNGDVYRDEFGGDDDGSPIVGYRVSAPLFLGADATYKVWNGCKLTGTIGQQSSFTQLIMVDGRAVDQSDVDYSTAILGGAQVGGSPIGQNPVGGPVGTQQSKPFLKDRTRGYVDAVGRALSVRHSFNDVNPVFSLDTLETVEKPSSYFELNESVSIFREADYLVDSNGNQVLDHNSNEITV